MVEPTIICPGCKTEIHLRKADDESAEVHQKVFQYLTGLRFRLRMETIVEALSVMRSDLDRERRAMMKQWAKRDEEIMRATDAVAGLHGDLQGIVGKWLPEIEGFQLGTPENNVNPNEEGNDGSL
jgi:hypothetical protein